MPAAVTAQIYKPGEVLCWEGDRGDEVWIVLQGNAEVWINGRPAPLSIPTKEKEEDAAAERQSAPEQAPKSPRPRRLTSRSATVSSSSMNAMMRSHDVGTKVATVTSPGFFGEVALLKGARKDPKTAGSPTLFADQLCACAGDCRRTATCRAGLSGEDGSEPLVTLNGSPLAPMTCDSRR